MSGQRLFRKNPDRGPELSDRANSLTILKSIESVRDWRRQQSIAPGFVPTMGALHEGHASLVRAAAATGAPTLVSIYVNPLQFGPGEDFARYPRTHEADLDLVQGAGGTAVWFPNQDELTPQSMVVSIDPGAMGDVLCGAWRPGHFRGVATIVLKLFEVVQPGSAFFGWKDAQQFVILRRMVEDLNLPVKMVGLETVRESDGLAMSSRNRYLSEELRREAAGIGRALQEARAWALGQGGEVVARDVTDRVRRVLQSLPNVEAIQYVEAVSLTDLTPLSTTRLGDTLLAVAVKYQQARLIDNVRW